MLLSEEGRPWFGEQCAQWSSVYADSQPNDSLFTNTHTALSTLNTLNETSGKEI